MSLYISCSQSECGQTNLLKISFPHAWIIRELLLFFGHKFIIIAANQFSSKRVGKWSANLIFTVKRQSGCPKNSRAVTRTNFNWIIIFNCQYKVEIKWYQLIAYIALIFKIFNLPSHCFLLNNSIYKSRLHQNFSQGCGNAVSQNLSIARKMVWAVNQIKALLCLGDLTKKTIFTLIR